MTARMLSRFLLLTSFSLGTAQALPPELKQTRFSGPDITPSPACLCAHPNGDVFVGVDMLGSLGKGAGKGKIVRLRDTNQDGQADEHTVFANIDNPRGLIAVGDKLYVLHTVIPADTGKMTGMHLSLLTDKDGDGKADGEPKRLVKNISTLLHNQKRGADHTTNSIRMGIDGWIYIAVGDFGMVDAEDAEGTKITILGGGILRVRPDGTEMELYTHGLRNIYDVAIDPFMNIFTRGNTNDGGGWNVRFIHQIQSGQYGYPILFKHFTDEIIPALVDVGGGSGTGAMFFQEPNWPEKYNNVPMMCDWGRNQLIIHRIKPDGPSFTQEPEVFIKCSQISDVDVDGSGRLYLSAWAGAGYKGNPNKGYVECVVPKDWKYKPFPDLTELSVENVIKGLRSPSSTARLHAQQEILHRGNATAAPKILAIVKDTKASAEARVAAIYTYAQLLGAKATKELLAASKDSSIREFCLRAATDRKSIAKTLPIEPFTEALKSDDPRVQVVAATSLGRIGKTEAAKALLSVAKPPLKDDTSKKEATKPLVFESKVLKGKDTVNIDVDINRIKLLYLVINDGGNGKKNDHGAWCEPMLVHTDGSKKPLTEFKWKVIGKSKIQKNKAFNGKPLVRADGTKVAQGIGAHADSVLLFRIPFEYVRFQATGSLTDTAGGSGSVKFILSASPPAKDGAKEGPHATPNPGIILPHVAVQSLISLHAAEACLAEIDSVSQDGALWALRWMHDPKVVDGLITKLQSTSDGKLQVKILTALARLYTKEKAYDGSWWWGTRPDTRGPYYVPEKWESSSKIEAAIRAAYAKAAPAGKNVLADIATKHRMNLEGIGKVEVVDKTAAAKKGELGRTSIEDVMLSLEKLKGNKERGQKVLAGMACVACHNMKPGDPIKGPDLFNMKLTKEQIAEAIIKPAATISESWVTVTMKDGTTYPGTLVSKDNKQVVVHNIAGIATKVKTADVKDIKKQTSTLMGPHLADELSLQQFADLIEYLHKKK